MMKSWEFAGKTVQELKEFAEKGEVFAMHKLGLHYGCLGEDENDENLSEEEATAIAIGWFIKAAELGLTDSESHLEVYYPDVKIDYDKIAAFNEAENKRAAEAYVANMDNPVVEDDDEDDDEVIEDYGMFDADSLKDMIDDGDTEAMFELGVRYLIDGDIGEDDEDIAEDEKEKIGIKYVTDAAEANNSGAQYWLASAYEKGNHVQIDLAASMMWMEKAADNGNELAQSILTGIDNAKIAEAQKHANDCYERKEYAEAAEWYYKAAYNGDAYSQFSLGFMLRRGQGVDKNLNTAIEWLKEAIKNGNEDAEKEIEAIKQEVRKERELLNAEELADKYVQNEEYDKALPHLKIIANAGDSWAQTILGTMYDEGKGVTPDKNTAFFWYEKAANNGDTSAMLFISNLYRLGSGVKKDMDKAVYWCEKGANLGNTSCKNVLDQYKELRRLGK